MNKKLKNYISVSLFAFFGGALRAYLNVIWSQAGTFVANIIGCFLLAFLTYFFLSLIHIFICYCSDYFNYY